MAEIVGIIGKSNQQEGDVDAAIAQKAQRLGAALGTLNNNLCLFTGGGSGYPAIVALEAKTHGAHAYAFSPAIHYESAQQAASSNTGFLGEELNQFSGTVFLTAATVSNEQKQRELSLSTSAVAGDIQKSRNAARSEILNDNIANMGGTVLIIGGGAGTGRELIDALKRKISVGILLGSGGMTDGLEDSAAYQKFIEDLSTIVNDGRSSTELIDIGGFMYASASPEQLAQMSIDKIKQQKKHEN